MRKSQTIPKLCATAFFLIVALIVSVPVLSVVFYRAFGGGTLEFGSAGSVEFRVNRPVEGNLYYVIGCTSDDDESESDFTLKNGTYCYLVTIGGRSLSEDSSNEVLLVRAPGNSQTYENLNNLWRNSANGEVSEPLLLSGVVKKGTENDRKIVEKICESINIENAKYIDFSIDCTKSVSSITNRFLISLIFYIGFVCCLLLSIQSVKRNNHIDNIEHQRAVTQTAQNVKSGNTNSEGTDVMFGESERSFAAQDTQFQGQQQYQREQQFFNDSHDNLSLSSKQGSDSDFDGFFGS